MDKILPLDKWVEEKPLDKCVQCGVLYVRTARNKNNICSSDSCRSKYYEKKRLAELNNSSPEDYVI